MCGIFGYFNVKDAHYGHTLKPLEKLINLSYQRGKEAAGMVALSEKNGFTIIKSDLDSRKLLKTPEYNQFIRHVSKEQVRSVVGHSRIATHGSQLIGENNQPVITANRSLAGVHNGIITNTSAIWQQMGRSEPLPALDSMVLFEYLEFLMISYPVEQAVALLFGTIEGAASIAVIIPGTDQLLLASNTGSLYYYTDTDSQAVFFASELQFLLKTFGEASREKFMHVSPGTASLASLSGVLTFNMGAAEERSITSEATPLPGVLVTDLSMPEHKSFARRHYTVVNDMDKLRSHDFDYDRIYAIQRCTNCILPATTPFITFDTAGVCNFCHEHEKITWKGRDALETIVSKYRKGNGKPDCLAAFSGGRDSSYGLHYLKEELGLQPLAYTYDWGMVTDIARRNQARILGKLGVEHLVVSADITKKRKHIRENILAWMKRPHLGMVPLFMEGDKQCEFYADQLMKNYDLKLMFFFRGNELEKEEFKNGHCGVKDADPGGVIHHLPTLKKAKLLSFYAGQYFRNPAYFNSSFLDTGLAFFSTYIQPHDYVYLWHYVPWDENEIISTLTREYNWELPLETKATWRTDDGSSAFYNYIYYQVQGFTENDSFRSRQVREGIMNREEALSLANEENKPRYDALKWYFDLVSLDGDAVLNVVDRMQRLY